ncbi:luciferin sulfotransferase-like, partial [Penaeus vannamei]|uniref:luciferin sulfotransferase-like n=1 Tax=Penaeus vannamei TaxID=6689 RepID=UPI00387F5B59
MSKCATKASVAAWPVGVIHGIAAIVTCRPNRYSRTASPSRGLRRPPGPPPDAGMYVKDYVEVQPSGAVFPNYLKTGASIHEFPLQKDDVWVVTYPKAGTTWTQELVWCLMLTWTPKRPKWLMKRFRSSSRSLSRGHAFRFDSPWTAALKFRGWGDDPMKPGETWKILQTLKSPRTIDLPVALLPKQLWTAHPKIIYVCRAPRTCVSYISHCIKLEGYTGNFDEFVKIFIGDMITYSPIWPTSLTSEEETPKQILFIRFEERKGNSPLEGKFEYKVL